MPTNACFSSMNSVGVPRLRRVLRGLAWLYPDIGYCQGTGMVRTQDLHRTTVHQPASSKTQQTHRPIVPHHKILLIAFYFCLPSSFISPPRTRVQVVSCLLLFLEEEDVLWMMCALIEDLLPPSYFSSTLLGVQTDQRVLRQLIVQYLPALDRLLQEHDIGKGTEKYFLLYILL